MVYISLIGSLIIILLSAEFFTNSIEWLGKKLNLSEGAVGSLLAAVGTALPETMIPLIAILFGATAESSNIGIGAILGAPFMLATMAMFVTGFAALQFRKKQDRPITMFCDANLPRRDLHYFIILYSLALLSAFLPSHNAKVAISILLLCGYIFYVKKTLSHGESTGDAELRPLYFQRKKPVPNLPVVIIQVIVTLVGIIAGADLFVSAITGISTAWGIPAFVLSLIIAPIATELPEKFNSVVWVRQGKDTLALGNITGAMVFQSTVIPAMGIALTPWELSPLALCSGLLALTASVFVLLSIRRQGKLKARNLISNGAIYILFILLVVWSGGEL